MVWIYVTIVFLIIILLYICLIKIKIISNHIEKNKIALESLYILISLFTITAVIIAIVSYYDQKSVIEDNKKIILENLEQEMSGNYQLIDNLIKNEEHFRNSYEFTSLRYNYHFLEESLTILYDKSLRRNNMIILDGMKQANEVMDSITNVPIFIPSKNEANAYLTLKNERINALMDNINFIAPRLVNLQNNLTKIGYWNDTEIYLKWVD